MNTSCAQQRMHPSPHGRKVLSMSLSPERARHTVGPCHSIIINIDRVHECAHSVCAGTEALARIHLFVFVRKSSRSPWNRSCPRNRRKPDGCVCLSATARGPRSRSVDCVHRRRAGDMCRTHKCLDNKTRELTRTCLAARALERLFPLDRARSRDPFTRTSDA